MLAMVILKHVITDSFSVLDLSLVVMNLLMVLLVMASIRVQCCEMPMRCNWQFVFVCPVLRGQFFLGTYHSC